MKHQRLPVLLLSMCDDENKVNRTELTPKKWFTKYWDLSNHNPTEMARTLGVSRTSIYYGLKYWGFKTDRSRVFIEIDGIIASISAHARRLDINLPVVWQRIYRGWTYVDALKTPLIHDKPGSPPKLFDYNGQKKPIYQLAEEYGLKHTTVQWRIHHGWTLEEALTIPAGCKKSLQQPLHNCSNPANIVQP